jgi:hypothetical protein
MGCAMKNLTMIFPHRKGDEYRARNLEVTLQYYIRYFPDVQKLVVEVSHEKQTVFPCDDYAVFYFTLPLPHVQAPVINAGVREATTDMVLVIDNDILAGATEIKELYRLMNKGKINYGHPFTHCCDLPESWDGTLQGVATCFKNHSCAIRDSFGRPCTGGIFMVRRDKYIEWGGTDEDFATYGGEDDERHARFLAKGAKYKRIEDGSIIHLWHPRQIQTLENIELIRKKSDWIDKPDKYR